MHRDRCYSRREFVGLATASLAVLAARPAFSAQARWSEPVIERFRISRVPGEFYRSIAMNAYDDAPKGKSGSIRVVQVVLSDGTTGLGVEGYSRVNEETVAGLQRLIGTSPVDFYEWDGEHIQGFAPDYEPLFQQHRFAFAETPMLDAVGKLRGKPVYALFGPAVRQGTDAYDGTLYFADIEHNRDASIVGEVAARIKADGYKAIKMKLGRPSKWLKGEAGVERDIEAVIAAREAVGSNFNLMADANNGYRDQFDWAVRLLEESDPYELYWMEEIFPEELDIYQRLRQAMLEGGFTTPIAEGESVRDVEDFRPYLENGIFEVIQPDMRTVGFSNILRGADMAQAHNAVLVPHNWQSEMGKVMSIHAALVHPSIQFVEDDRFRNFALDTSNYLFRDGQWFAPERPGWGIDLVDGFDRLVSAQDDLIIS